MTMLGRAVGQLLDVEVDDQGKAASSRCARGASIIGRSSDIRG